MADGRSGRGGTLRRALIGPLVMLTGGVAASVFVWRFLMLAPAPGVPHGEHLSAADQGALERLLRQTPAR